MFLAGQTVTMVMYCGAKMIPMRSPMIGQCFDTMMVTSTDRVVVITHQNLCLEMFWKLFQ